MNKYQFKELNENIKELKGKQDDNKYLIIFMSVLIFINIILTIAVVGMTNQLYKEYMPKKCECNCNNELIIDTDTMTL